MSISKISVLTATYNRSEMLTELYDSLVKQTNQNFEWIVVDDGSTDDTVSAMTSIIDKHKEEFRIKFQSQPNGGKHRALNLAMKFALGEVVFIVDSDDVLSADAINSVISNWDEYYDDDRVAIVSFLRISREGRLLGQFGDDIKVGSLLDLKYHKNLKGDFAETIRASLLKEIPFPEIPNEKFMSEGWLFKKIALLGKLVVNVPDSIYICDYLEGGLTKSGLVGRLNSPEGMLLNSNLNLRVFTNVKEIVKNIFLYDVYLISAKRRGSRITKRFQGPYVIAKVMFYPAAVCFMSRNIKK